MSKPRAVEDIIAEIAPDALRKAWEQQLASIRDGLAIDATAYLQMQAFPENGEAYRRQLDAIVQRIQAADRMIKAIEERIAAADEALR